MHCDDFFFKICIFNIIFFPIYAKKRTAAGKLPVAVSLRFSVRNIRLIMRCALRAQAYRLGHREMQAFPCDARLIMPYSNDPGSGR